MSAQKIQPWRKAHESFAAAAWTVSAVLSGSVAAISTLPPAPFKLAAITSGLMGFVRGVQAYTVWKRKLALLGKTLEFVTPDVLLKNMAKRKKDGVYMDAWLGWGFEWTREHAQAVYDFKWLEIKDILPPPWFCKLYGKKFNAATGDDLGAPWIHGVEPKESELFVPVGFLNGHTLITGVTGSGKTRLFDLLVMQAVVRGDVVIVLDPKGDKEMRERTEYAVKLACESSGRTNNFRFFHPAFTSGSIRLDPLKNFGNVTELASRVSALIPSESGSDAFKSFAFRVLNIVAEGLVASGESPTLKRLRKYIEGGPEGLLQRNLETHFNANIGNWEALAEPHIAKVKGGAVKLPSPQSTAYLHGLVIYYQQEASKIAPSDAVDKLINLYLHSREHFGKMIGNLLPILDMLCSGELGKLLSPDPDDINDEREIMDTGQIIASGAVVYMGLNSLSDSTVASAIGSIVLADLAATAGAIYNYSDKKRRVSIFVDEASEIAGDGPFVQLLNKGRGSGFQTTVATQTVADFASRLGSQEKADMVLGNFNNYICQRVTDSGTQEFISEKFGEVYIQETSESHSQSTGSDGDVNFSGGDGMMKKRTLAPRVPADLLGRLPNLQYFGLLADGRLVKGRLPIIQE